MGRAAREAYLARYTPEINYVQLIRIYREALSCYTIRKSSPLPYAQTRSGR